MSRRNPFEEIEQMFDRMSSQFEGMPGGGGTGAIALDLEDTDDTLVVTADLPGYTRENIDLSVSQRTLHVGAEREETTETGDEGEDGEGRYLRRERHRQSVSRSLSLPDRVAESEASATHKNGVLTVTLPKASTEDRGENIEID